MTEIEQKVTDLIVEKLGVEPSQVVREASFTNDLGADSLETVELMMELEKEFDMQIPEELTEKITTVGDVFDYMNDPEGFKAAHA